MERKVYETNNVCARRIEFDYEDGRIYNLVFEGGCRGNLAAIGKLCEGKKLEELVEFFDGNTCGSRTTSCADQLAQAVKEIIK